MEVEIDVAEIVVAEEVLGEANGAFFSLANANTFINEIVDLCGY